MAIVEELTPIWDEIDRAEGYLVCCLFDEAASLAASILGRLIENYKPFKENSVISEDYENDWNDMVESAGMVIVQSMKQLQRSSEILEELTLLFGSLTAIPFRVFLTGVCIQMSESPATTIQGSLEEFLNNWRYADDQYYQLLGDEASVSGTEGSCFRFSITVDEYLEVVELYVIKLLAMTIKDTDLAISWVEKAMLPVEKRQELLRRLQSMNSLEISSSSQKSISPRQPNGYNPNNLSLDHKLYGGQYNDNEPKNLLGGQNTSKAEILKLSRQRVPYLKWFPTISFKIGNIRLVVPNGKMVLALFVILFYYLARRKQALLKRFLTDKAVSLKRGLLDLWRLAFSYQVNPLAAIQTLPSTGQGNH